MAALTIKIDLTKLRAKLTTLRKVNAAITPQVYTYFRSITPIRSGNARNQTQLAGLSIRANYPYAIFLDAGRSSQAPQGMSEPSKVYAMKLALDYIRKNGGK